MGHVTNLQIMLDLLFDIDELLEVCLIEWENDTLALEWLFWNLLVAVSATSFDQLTFELLQLIKEMSMREAKFFSSRCNILVNDLIGTIKMVHKGAWRNWCPDEKS